MFLMISAHSAQSDTSLLEFGRIDKRSPYIMSLWFGLGLLRITDESLKKSCEDFCKQTKKQRNKETNK